MPRVPLTGNPYAARSIIASAQRAINLYAESNADPSAPVPITLYPTPGLTLVGQSPNVERVRQVYRATNGQMFVCVGPQVYYVDNTFTFNLLGTIPDAATPVYFSDNGLVIVLVDGSAIGYAIDLTLHTFGTITDPNYLGATRVDFIDTFFIFNQPTTANLYISLSEITYGMLTQTAIGDGTIVGGTGYTAGVYQNVMFTGGSGTGATGTVTIDAGNIQTGSITAAGTLYTPGSYTGVPLTGGAGSGATANITVNGAGHVSVVTIVFGGASYLVGDILSASNVNIGGTGSAFTWTVATIATVVIAVDIGNPGVGYLIGDVLSAPAASIGGTGSGFTYTVSVLAPAFDPLDIAAKSGSADPIQVVVVVHREVWPIGTLTSETWYDSGAADFPLQALPGAFVEHGCIAPYSVALHDNSAFWLHQDRQGDAIVIKTSGYQALRISTHAIEQEFQSYPNITDAIGYTFQQEGHTFYVLIFPSADKTWAVDLQSLQWFEWASIDGNGVLHRHRSNCSCFAYGKNIVGDWQNGYLYALDPDNFTDNGTSIPRIRSFPHLLNDGKRVTYTQFIADMQVGTLPNILFQDGPDFNNDFNDDFGPESGTPDPNIPKVNLRWSDTRGVSYGNYVPQSLGAGGQYLTNISWWRLGMARDRVFELSWSVPTKTALNGAFIEFKPHKT